MLRSRADAGHALGQTESGGIIRHRCGLYHVPRVCGLPRAKLRDFGKVIKNALKTLAIVMTLLATAKAFAYMMTELRIPAMITEVLLSVTSNKYVLMLIINILLLLLLGCFMDMAPLITIMTPILLPVVTNPAIGMQKDFTWYSMGDRKNLCHDFP